jgi:hypothetical protein
MIKEVTKAITVDDEGQINFNAPVNCKMINCKMVRVDNGALEKAQIGVEYYSDHQQGGIFGTVIRTFFGALTDQDTIKANVSKLVATSISITNESYRTVATDLEKEGAGESVRVKLTGTTGKGNLVLTITGYTCESGWVDYIK